MPSPRPRGPRGGGRVEHEVKHASPVRPALPECVRGFDHAAQAHGVGPALCCVRALQERQQRCAFAQQRLGIVYVRLTPASEVLEGASGLLGELVLRQRLRHDADETVTRRVGDRVVTSFQIGGRRNGFGAGDRA